MFDACDYEPGRPLPLRRRFIAGAMALALPVATAAAYLPPTRAPTAVPVSNCDDSGPGSLRDAVASAASGDTIDLSSLTCSTITLTSGQIEIPQDDLYIKYAGAGGTPPTIDANLSARALHHAGVGTLKLVGLAIQNGKYANTYSYYPTSAKGGCVYSAGNVYLAGSTLTNCTAKDYHGQGAAGGAIYTQGSLTIVHGTVSHSTAYSDGQFADGGGAFTHGAAYLEYSAISDNVATGTLAGAGAGLAIVNAGTATSTITNTTIDGNTADRGGGMMISGTGSSGAAIAIVDSTISGNTANGYAAAASFHGPVTIVSSTIAFNTSQTSSGISLVSMDYPVRIESSIIADNTNGSFDYDIGSRGYAITIAGSHNIVIDAALGIVLPPDTIDAEPVLQPLADNGGSTRTHALGDGSPALDAGDNAAALGFDQRGTGYPRVFGIASDIGAFERESASDTIFVNGFDAGAREPAPPR